MSMTSIYCGAHNIHHVAVKVTAPDGSFAETPPPKTATKPLTSVKRLKRQTSNWEKTETSWGSFI